MSVTFDPPDFATRIADVVAKKIVPAVSREIMAPEAIKLEREAKRRWPVDTGASKAGLRVQVDESRLTVRIVVTNPQDYVPYIRTEQNGLRGQSPLEVLIEEPLDELERKLKGIALRRLIAREIKKGFR